jgi:putative membrane protein
MVIFSPEAHEAVRHAIETCEEKTAGEIYCVIAHEASDYSETPIAWAAFSAFFVPLAFLVFSIWQQGWTIAHIGGAKDAIGLSWLVVLQALTFSGVWLLASVPVARSFLTPAPLKRERVRQRALEQFHAHNLHQTEARTGVLIFVSLSERMAELLADEGINRLVEPGAWRQPMNELVDAMRRQALAEGLIAAVNKTGAILAAYVPARAVEVNELPDAVVELPRH